MFQASGGVCGYPGLTHPGRTTPTSQFPGSHRAGDARPHRSGRDQINTNRPRLLGRTIEEVAKKRCLSGVTLHFVGVQGSEHQLEVDGHDGIVTLKRGEMKSVTITATKPGIMNYRSLGRQPSMTGQLVVLPKQE